MRRIFNGLSSSSSGDQRVPDSSGNDQRVPGSYIQGTSSNSSSRGVSAQRGESGNAREGFQSSSSSRTSSDPQNVPDFYAQAPDSPNSQQSIRGRNRGYYGAQRRQVEEAPGESNARDVDSYAGSSRAGRDIWYGSSNDGIEQPPLYMDQSPTGAFQVLERVNGCPIVISMHRNGVEAEAALRRYRDNPQEIVIAMQKRR